MTERERQILALLQSYNDYLPPLTRASLNPTPGPSPGRKVKCGSCLATGRVRKGQTLANCRVCDGTGWRKRRPGETAVDEYTGEEVGSEQDALRTMTMRELDSNLSALEIQAKARVGIDDGTEPAWVTRWRLSRQQGSYAKVADALSMYADIRPAHARALLQVHLLGWGDAPIADRRRLLEEGLVELASMIEGEIRVPRWLGQEVDARNRAARNGRSPAHEKQRGIRNQEIRDRAAAGVSTSRLAADYGISRRQIQVIVRP